MADPRLKQRLWSAGLIALFFLGWELFCLVSGADSDATGRVIQ